MDYRGHHRKGVSICNATKTIYNQNLCFIEQKMYFWTPHRGSKTLSWKYFSDNLFRAAPFRLMLVLHKDALFHCENKHEGIKATNQPLSPRSEHAAASLEFLSRSMVRASNRAENWRIDIVVKLSQIVLKIGILNVDYRSMQLQVENWWKDLISKLPNPV